MNGTAGWNIWGETNARVRQFTVAKVKESDALALLQAKHPEVKPISRHTMAASTIRMLKMADGQITEWVETELSARGGQMRPGGVPIDQPMQ